MAERAKFEKWLLDLEAKRTSTPTHVFDRVKADYSLRLEGVLDKLREHTAEMREHSENLTEKLRELEDSEQNLVDEKAENALRAEVGELSENEWESFSRKAERTLAKLREDQEVIAADLQRIRELLGSVEPRPAAPDAEPPAPAAAAPKQAVDELEFLKSVVGSTPPRAPAAAATPALPAAQRAEPKPEPKKEASVEAPEAKAGPAASAPAKQPAPPAPQVAPPAEPLIAKPVTGPVIQSKGNQDSIGTRMTGSNPLVLKNTGSQDVPKTLKCSECGAMNYPSEWYCERCGAELANI